MLPVWASTINEAYLLGLKLEPLAASAGLIELPASMEIIVKTVKNFFIKTLKNSLATFLSDKKKYINHIYLYIGQIIPQIDFFF